MVVYVIIVETGEYSDRFDWVGGVFDDEETAHRTIQEKSAAARERSIQYEAWLRKQWKIRERFPQPLCWSNDGQVKDAIDREAGPVPTGEPGDNFYLIEVPLNQWGNFDFGYYKPPVPLSAEDRT